MARFPSWPPEELDRFVAAYEAGVSEPDLLRMFPGRTVGAFRGRVIRLQLKRPIRAGVKLIKADHPAVLGARTLFPSRVREVEDAPALLAPGEWQRKLGARVVKGAWAGMPIYALTLEERATCPASCHHWRSCMGNSMQLAWRNRHGPQLLNRLRIELAALQAKHPGGFVVRLHILGDFFSTEYAQAWGMWLLRFPALRVFGYTAWPPNSPIGRIIGKLSSRLWQRFAIRWSSREPGPTRAITIWEWPKSEIEAAIDRVDKVIVCPAELGKTKGCGTCGLCWSPAARDLTIGFIAHGRSHRKWERPDLAAAMRGPEGDRRRALRGRVLEAAE